MSFLWLLLPAVAVAAGVVISGCGGHNATRYSKPAFVACLEQDGVPSQDIKHPVTALDRAVANALRPIAPNLIVAKFRDGEFVGVAFAADAARASQILRAFKKLVKLPGATPGKLILAGNLVLLTNPHITAGVKSTINACEADAVIK